MSTTFTPSAQLSFDDAASAIRTAMEHADADWKRIALEKVRHLCVTLPEFTTDELHAELAKTMAVQHELRALGGIMLQAARKGWCAKTDRVRSTTRPEAHSRPVAIWLSLLYSPPQ